MNDKVLIVDDERNIVEAIAYGLKREGYFVETACNGEEAITNIKNFKPTILILDIMMPEMNGIELLKKVGDNKNMGIIMLTAKNDITDKILGLELGADDYMTKPFDMRELIARTKSMVRRLKKDNSVDSDIIKVGESFKINPSKRTCIIDNISINLTPKEFDLLFLLLNSNGMVFTREQLLDLIWDMDYAGGTRTVDIHIQRLRKKVGGKYQHILQTVHGIGYKALR